MPSMDTSPTAPIVVESLRPGVFVDTAGVSHTFTRADLEQIAADYDPAVFRSPVVIGHPKTNHPAWGWIDAATVGDDDHLRVEFSAVDPAFAAAVAKKHYTKVSMALFAPRTPGNPTPGKWYIRHLGYLGAAAPAIPDLASADFAGPTDGIVEFAALDAPMWSLSRVLRNLREWLIGQHGAEAADRVIPSYQVEEFEAAARAESEATQPALFQAPPDPAPPTPTTEESSVTEEEAAALRAQNAALQAEIAASKASREEAERAARHQAHVTFAAGLTSRVPPSEHPRLVSLLDAVAQLEAPVEFAAGDGSAKQEAPAEALCALLSALPEQVPTGEAAGGAEFAAPDGADAAAIAREARALMAEAERDGRSLDSATAVATVQARRAS